MTTFNDLCNQPKYSTEYYPDQLERAVQIMEEYYNHNVEDPLPGHANVTVGLICSALYLLDTHQAQKEAVDKMIRDDLNDYDHHLSECYRIGKFMNATEVIKGGQHPDNISKD